MRRYYRLRDEHEEEAKQAQQAEQVCGPWSATHTEGLHLTKPCHLQEA